MLLYVLLALSLTAQEDVLRQAIILHKAGDTPAAIDTYKKYLATSPGSFLAHSNLGAAYAKLARYPEAIAEYRLALKLQPDNQSVLLNLGLAQFKTGQIDKAAPTFERVHRADPAQMQPVYLLADCWLAMGKNKQVIEFLTPVSKRLPDDLAIVYLLGTALVRDNQMVEGQLVIDRILRQGDSAEARLLLGTTKLNAQDYPAALIDLGKAVELNPKLPDVHRFHGQALLGTGDSDGASAAFRQALAANPNDYTSNFQLALLLLQDDNLDEARACFDRALLTQPGDIAVRYQLATLYLRQGDSNAARKSLEAIVKEAPAYTEAHVSLATVYYRLNRKHEGDRERAIAQKLIAATQAKQQQGINIK